MCLSVQLAEIMSKWRLSALNLTQGTHICITELGNHWFRPWLVAYLLPGNFLKTNDDLFVLFHPLGTDFG